MNATLGANRRATTVCVVVAALMGACGTQPRLGESAQPSPRCTASIDAVTNARLADGRGVYVEARTVAYGGGRLLVLGERVLFDENGTVTRASSDGQSVVGILVDSDGRATFVRAPPGDTSLVAPRALYQDDGRWTVIWIRVKQRVVSSLGAGTLVQATYDGRTWTEPAQVASFDRVLLDADLSRQVAELPRGFAFVQPIRQDSGKGDLAIIVSENGAWRRSDVPRSNGALYSAVARVHGRWIVAYVGIDTAGTGLFAVRSTVDGQGWSVPTRLPANHGYSAAFLNLTDGLALLTLGEASPFHPRGLFVLVSRDDGATWSSPASVVGADSATAFATVILSSRLQVVLKQQGQSFRRTNVVGVVNEHSIRWLRSDSVDAIGTPSLARGDGDDALVVWGAVDSTGSVPKPKLNIARYRLACSK